MFGLGGQEIILVGLLVLLLFGPNKLPQMARDVGRFVTQARSSIDEFKEELTSFDDEEEERPKRNGKPRKKQREEEDEEVEHDL